MFTVGADVNIFQEISSAEDARDAARHGQDIFDLLESLPFKTVAAIDGPCVGGGCELSLACNYRIASDNEAVLVGLPEIKLGILPGFGGTQRLPRIVGISKALEIILAGKTLRGKPALSRGLVDEIVPADQLLDRAERYASGAGAPKAKGIGLVEKALTFTGFGRGIVKKKALANVQKQTKGFYPAPLKALDITLYGLERGKSAGLIKEAEALGELLVSPESRALVNVFFRTEDAKGIGKSAKKAVEHVQAIVIGAGVMGAGIAGAMAKNKCQVILKDTSDEGLERGVSQIRKYLEGIRYLKDKDRSFILNRIETTTKDSSNIGNATFALEAVFEDLEVKKKVLGAAAELMPEDAIIATNTSSLSVTEIATAIEKPERVVGMHFFNPVEKMPLVEIVHGEKTSDKTIAIVAALSSKLGKFPIVVRDVPGFLVNRILTPYLNEAAFLLEDGFTIEAIDRAATAFGMPMGPIRLLDEVGLDVAMHVSEIMVRGYGDRMKGPGQARKMVDAGRKGKKSGKGFYLFEEGQKERVDSEVYSLLGLSPSRGKEETAHIQDRLIYALIREAVLCLDEGVAGVPGPQAAQQIDLGTVMGTGFPPFRGGLIWYMDSLGAKAIEDKLSALEAKCGERFAPVEGITNRAAAGKSFYDC
jgi:3-hydroxyacyl-CoA dehydrogenase/enoyl-CoA hydratase/3-hydroxybutyryl-CoA epimerase